MTLHLSPGRRANSHFYWRGTSRQVKTPRAEDPASSLLYDMRFRVSLIDNGRITQLFCITTLHARRSTSLTGLSEHWHGVI